MPRYLIQVVVSRLVEADDQEDAELRGEEFASRIDTSDEDTIISFGALPLTGMPVVSR